MGGLSAISAACLVLLLAFSTRAAVSEEGRQIYEQGRLGNGATLEGMVQDDIRLGAKQLACANCHRRSGMGSSEGGIVVPPVTAEALFTPRTVDRRELYAARTEGGNTRPAYTVETLKRAIREGIDAAGNPLDRLMPRYAMDDKTLSALIGYLNSLSATDAPGVDAHRIHFATITSDRVGKRSETALLTLLQAFFESKNGNTRREKKRAKSPPWHKDWIYPAYRTWVLHHWRLTGPVASWREQLDAYYREQPVFAILSGSIGAPWRVVHDFSEDNGVPTLLPHTAWPEKAGHYTIYSSEGPVLKARAIARDLASRAVRRAVQISGSQEIPGPDLLREQWGGGDLTDIALDQASPAEIRHRLSRIRPQAVILWLDGIESGALRSEAAVAVEDLYLAHSGMQLPEPQAFTLFEAERIHTPRLLVPPEQAEERLRGLRAWAQAQQLPLIDPHLMADAFLALSATGEALMHMKTNFSRDYFIEKLEHVFNRTTFPGLYPELSLAPGQRFIAKRWLMVELDADGRPLRERWEVP